jgi:hypothetical protein
MRRTAETDHQGPGAQRGPRLNVHAVWGRVPREAYYANCRRLGSVRKGFAEFSIAAFCSPERADGDRLAETHEALRGFSKDAGEKATR